MNFFIKLIIFYFLDVELISYCNLNRIESPENSHETFTNHSKIPLVILPNGDIASGTNDSKILVWDTLKKVVKYTINTNQGRILSLAILPNGNIASGSDDYSIKVWNFETKLLEFILIDHKSSVEHLIILPDGDLLSGYSDGLIIIWNIKRRKWKLKIKDNCQHNSINGLILMNNGGDLAYGCENGHVKIFDLEMKKVKLILKGHKSPVLTFLNLPNGQLVSASQDKLIIIWDLVNLKEKFRFNIDQTVKSFVYYENNILIIVSNNGNLLIWNLRNNIIKLKMKTSFVSTAALPNRLLAGISVQHKLNILNI